MATPPSLRGGWWPRQVQRDSASRSSPCSMRTPVLGVRPTTAGQRRFVHATYTFAHLYERLREGIGQHGYVLGVAPHSLRAVTPEELGQVVRLAAPDAPVHIHAAGADHKRSTNATRGAACVRSSGCLRRRGVDARWCIVHATHMTDKEVTGLAASGAVAGIAPTTEADLGDGTFRARLILLPAAGLAWAAIRIRSSIPLRNSGNSNGRSGCARAGAMC